MSINAAIQPPLRSEFGSDPDMTEILQQFVGDMPAKTSSLNQFWSSQDLESLRRLAHQIKGASAGYGFPSVGAAAGRVEQSLIDLGNGSVGASLDALRRDVNDLINLCQRVSL